LAPVLSSELLQVHHKKHHQTYINNLNVTLDKMTEARQKGDFATLASLTPALRSNYGGHVNHSIYWQNLTPKPIAKPPRELETALTKTFGSVDSFRDQLSAASVSVMGSGWGWLGYCPRTGQLRISSSPNQEPLDLPSSGLVPLLLIDVWEHAYYLQYKNVRADYVKALWQVVNWNDVAERLAKAQATFKK
jgi:Fe-Mn family superoxide dismutase